MTKLERDNWLRMQIKYKLDSVLRVQFGDLPHFQLEDLFDERLWGEMYDQLHRRLREQLYIYDL